MVWSVRRGIPQTQREPKWWRIYIYHLIWGETKRKWMEVACVMGMHLAPQAIKCAHTARTWLRVKTWEIFRIVIIIIMTRRCGMWVLLHPPRAEMAAVWIFVPHHSSRKALNAVVQLKNCDEYSNSTESFSIIYSFIAASWTRICMHVQSVARDDGKCTCSVQWK